MFRLVNGREDYLEFSHYTLYYIDGNNLAVR